VLVYDTQDMKAPLLYVTAVHFTPLTDLAWSKVLVHVSKGHISDETASRASAFVSIVSIWGRVEE